MSTENEQMLAEAVRKYPALYDKRDKYFKDRNKKRLAWEDVAKEANLANGKNILNYYNILIILNTVPYSNFKVLKLLFTGNIAERTFRNLRTKYGKQKKKWDWSQ